MSANNPIMLLYTLLILRTVLMSYFGIQTYPIDIQTYPIDRDAATRGTGGICLPLQNLGRPPMYWSPPTVTTTFI